jgi:hypothetical protein
MCPGDKGLDIADQGKITGGIDLFPDLVNFKDIGEIGLKIPGDLDIKYAGHFFHPAEPAGFGQFLLQVCICTVLNIPQAQGGLKPDAIFTLLF